MNSTKSMYALHICNQCYYATLKKDNDYEFQLLQLSCKYYKKWGSLVYRAINRWHSIWRKNWEKSRGRNRQNWERQGISLIETKIPAIRSKQNYHIFRQLFWKYYIFRQLFWKKLNISFRRKTTSRIRLQGPGTTRRANLESQDLDICGCCPQFSRPSTSRGWKIGKTSSFLIIATFLRFPCWRASPPLPSSCLDRPHIPVMLDRLRFLHQCITPSHPATSTITMDQPICSEHQNMALQRTIQHPSLSSPTNKYVLLLHQQCPVPLFNVSVFLNLMCMRTRNILEYIFPWKWVFMSIEDV